MRSGASGHRKPATGTSRRGGYGGEITDENRYSNVLRVRIEPELLGMVRREADRYGIDVSTYIRWCIQTGLYLEDLNQFLRSKSKEMSMDECMGQWNH